MTSISPYLIRAIYDWIIDNGFTPYLLVNATMEGVHVPVEHIENGKIVLNLSPNAVHGLELGDEWIMFNARFSGAVQHIAVPTDAAIAIYAKENGQGMVLEERSQTSSGARAPATSPTTQSSKPEKKPSLSLVK